MHIFLTYIQISYVGGKYMRKKFVSILMSTVLCLTLLAGCGDSEADTKEAENKVDASKIKIGAIYVGDENEGYTAAHMEGIKEMAKEYGLSDDQIIEKTCIKEDESCYDAAIDLADQGCNIIFANSFGHEDYILRAAAEYKDVTFCHASGYQAASSGLENMHNYFDSIYEARYVSGVVAGLKLKEMIDNGKITKEQEKIGYVGAFPYAEVISGYTAFYLGVKSIVSDVTMEVQYTNSWADSTLEGETASALIADGCVLISQHADTTGAPAVCEAKGIPVVGYNVDMSSVAPNTTLTSPTNNWGVYYKYAVGCLLDGTKIDTDWCKGYADDAVGTTVLGKACASGTKEEVEKVVAALKDGSLHVFDTSKFTVENKQVTTWKNKAGIEYIKDGYFHESEGISAPAFELKIDGIESK